MPPHTGQQYSLTGSKSHSEAPQQRSTLIAPIRGSRNPSKFLFICLRASLQKTTSNAVCTTV